MQKTRISLTILGVVLVAALAFGVFPVSAAYFVNSAWGEPYQDTYRSQASVNPDGTLQFDTNMFGSDDATANPGRRDRDADAMGLNPIPYSYGLQGNYWYWQR